MPGVARLATAVIILTAASAMDPLAASSPDPAPRGPAVDTYWGTRVVDTYRNLENVDDPTVIDWLTARDARARQELEAYPSRRAIEQRVVSLTRLQTPLYYDPRVVGSRTFFLEKRAPRERPALVSFDDVRDLSTIETLLDPTQHDLTGRSTIDFFVPSPNGFLVAVSMSVDGAEHGTLHVFDTRSGREADVRITGVHSGTAGGSVAWDEKGGGFFYTRHPVDEWTSESDRFFDQRVYYHELGRDPSNDPLAVGDRFPRVAKVELSRSDDGRHHLARVADGDGGDFAFWLRGPSGDWRLVAGFDDLAQRALFGHDDAIYFLSRRDAPTRQILRMPLDAPSISAAELVVEAGIPAIDSYAVTDSRVYIVEMLAGVTRLRVYGLDGTPLDLVNMGELVSITDLVARDGDEVLFRSESFLDPPAWYLYSPARRAPARTALVHESPADFSDVEVRREMAFASDGARIPVSVLIPKGLVRNGTAPALLRGYGAYGISMTPSFDATARLWLDQGGVFAVAHVRGGGEYGDDWHSVARLENKKRSVDDFAACARYLVAAGYTSPERLAIEGASAGGLLAYSTMVLYPDRVAAVVSHAGVSDVLRSETSPNGAFNVTEFGTVEKESQFRGMYSYSPYHNVFDGEPYPALLSFAGLNDVRVEPWHALKMTARLIEAGSGSRVLLRVNGQMGHAGSRLSDKDRVRSDVFTFLMQELDVEFRAPGTVATAD